MPAHDPAVRRQVATIGAHASWAKTPDATARTANARKGFIDKFEREVDPNGTLPSADRARRVEHAKKAYFLGLALKSAQARRKKAS